MRALARALALSCLAALAIAPAAGASFGLNGFQVAFEAKGGGAAQAGSHPDGVINSFKLNHGGGGKAAQVDGEVKDATVVFPPGFIGDATAMPQCPVADFSGVETVCPQDSKIGTGEVELYEPGHIVNVNIFSLAPPPGVPVLVGFKVAGAIPVSIDLGLEQHAPYRVVATSRETRQSARVFGLKLTVWGVPSDHNPAAPEKPFLTLPTSCTGPAQSSYEALSWEGESDAGSTLSEGFGGCGALGFHPQVSSKATADSASSATGLDFSLDFDQQGLTSTEGLAQSTIERAEVTLPKGLTADASLAEGIGTCSTADLAREQVGTAPGEGCPNASKIGSVEVQTPLLEGAIGGDVYLATPYENLADNSLIAFYIVLKDPAEGILVKLPAKVTPDPGTGQLVTTVEGIPRLPFSHFSFHFREGQRAPLISPPGCGTFTTTARLTPSARPSEPITETASFQITRGVGGGPCPSGAAPFAPDFEAGADNDQAGRYSPFSMRLTRGDGEQDMTKFSSVLPPGVLGRLAGVPYCPESDIAQALSRTGEHGGTAERNDPSCPLESQIGTTVAAAGVGSALTYVPGRLYLAGPYHGDPLSVVAITPAVAGPFDAGAVVVREALTLNPVSAEAEVDGSASDPIPHILQGIPLNLRDLRVHVDRSGFTLNPTSCAEEQAKATLWGGGTALSPLPDHPVGLASRFQAAGCASLAFKPKLALKLKGGTRRGAFPRLRALYTPRAGDANLKRLALRFPHSEFIEQGHFRTICTRVQFAAGPGHGARCPKGSVYGHARVWSPLLSEPLKGPVFLRSSSHNLPDAVFALHGVVDLEVALRIDSAHGGLRATLQSAPDAPVSRAIVDMQGGQKGLFVNSTNICRRPHRANAALAAQNGRRQSAKPLLRPRCPKHRRHRRHRRSG